MSIQKVAAKPIRDSKSSRPCGLQLVSFGPQEVSEQLKWNTGYVIFQRRRAISDSGPRRIRPSQA